MRIKSFVVELATLTLLSVIISLTTVCRGWSEEASPTPNAASSPPSATASSPPSATASPTPSVAATGATAPATTESSGGGHDACRE